MDTQENLIEKNIIFVRDPNRKSGYISFKLDLTKKYIKQFLLTLLEAQVSVAAFTYRKNIYIVNNTEIPSSFKASDLCLRSNKSFVRDLSEIGNSEATAKTESR